jgi:hypothetical protein
LALALLLLGSLIFAQTDGKQPGKLPVKPAEPPAKKPEPIEKPDPTKPTPELRQALEVPKGGPDGAAPRMPAITLKGRVIAQDQPPAALLEIDPRQPPRLVTKGSVVVLNGNLRLRVVEVTVGEVRIEVSPLNETIILR